MRKKVNKIFRLRILMFTYAFPCYIVYFPCSMFKNDFKSFKLQGKTLWNSRNPYKNPRKSWKPHKTLTTVGQIKKGSENTQKGLKMVRKDRKIRNGGKRGSKRLDGFPDLKSKNTFFRPGHPSMRRGTLIRGNIRLMRRR